MSQQNESHASHSRGKGYTPEPTGYLFGRFGLLMLLGIILLAAWYDQIVIVILLGLALGAAGVAKAWSRLSLVGVSCQRLLSEQRAFPGETIESKLRLVNRKLLPLPWVQVDDEVPEALAPQDLSPSDGKGFRSLSYGASLLWYTAINWRSRLLCRKRGYYRLGPLTVSSGDIFGLYPRATTQPIADHVIVYPRLFQIDRRGIPSLYPVGETRADRRIFEDLTRTIGVRDYTPHDSLRHVHWKASARHQSLQVKVFEATTTLKVALFLAVDTFTRSDPEHENDFELGISTAASMANYVVAQRSSVGLFANTRQPDSGQPIRILPGGGQHQLVNILEALAKVVYSPSGPFADFFEVEWGSLPWGTTVVLVVSQPPDSLPAVLVRLREAGYKALVLQIGEKTGVGASNHATAWYSVSSAGNSLEFALRSLE